MNELCLFAGIGGGLLGSKKAISMTHRYGMMSQHLMADRGVEKWMSLLPDSHASHFQLQGSKKARQMTETSGLILSESFGKFDPDTSFLRTYQPSLLTNTYIPYSESWPKAGIIVDGIAFALQTLVRRTEGKGCGLWRTPDTGAGGTSGLLKKGITQRPDGQMVQVRLVDQVMNPRMWPTPANQEPGWKNIEVVDKNGNPPEHPNQRFYDKDTGRLVQKGLEQVARMWPTPKAQDWGGSTRVDFSPKLSEKVKELDGHIPRGGQKIPQMQLNPEWEDWLMGFPIGWSGKEALEMHRFRLWWQQHGGC